MNAPGGSPADDDSESGVIGLHHIRIPVSDPWASRDWYAAVPGFLPVLDLEEEQRVVGVVMRHPCGVMMGLHYDPARAAALRGFAVLGLTVANRASLERWAKRLDELAIQHTRPEEGHLGWYLDVPDPDGILVRFHTGTAPDAEEA